MEDKIKSPFMGNTKVIRKSTDPQEMAEGIIENFAKLLRQYEEDKQETDQFTFVNYLAGVSSVLMIMGFGREGTEAVVEAVHEVIGDIAKEGCGECDHCKNAKD